MKSITSIAGIVLIIIGIITLSYEGYTYTSQKNIADIGPIKITEETEKTIPFSPILGGLCLVSGIVLILIAKSNKK